MNNSMKKTGPFSKTPNRNIENHTFLGKIKCKAYQFDEFEVVDIIVFCFDKFTKNSPRKGMKYLVEKRTKGTQILNMKC